jgi:hypothetical protein
MSKRFPNNPYCKRPAKSGMRHFCTCLDCRRYDEEQTTGHTCDTFTYWEKGTPARQAFDTIHRGREDGQGALLVLQRSRTDMEEQS